MSGNQYESSTRGGPTDWKKVSGKNVTEVIRYARLASECFSSPHNYETAKEYLATLTDVLRDLSKACGYEPPEDIAEHFGIAS
jgi:hypothetical protein